MRKRQEDQDLLPEVTAMWNQRAKRGVPGRKSAGTGRAGLTFPANTLYNIEYYPCAAAGGRGRFYAGMRKIHNIIPFYLERCKFSKHTAEKETHPCWS